MSSFAFDIEKPCLQRVPWATGTEAVVALEHEVQNHCRGENPKTRSPTAEGLSPVPALSGSSDGWAEPSSLCPRGGLYKGTPWMPRKHELDPNLPFKLGLFFLVRRTDSRGCSNWGSLGGHPKLGGVLGVSGSQCQEQIVFLWVRAPAQAVCEQEVLFGEAHYTTGGLVLQVGGRCSACLEATHSGNGRAMYGCGYRVLGRVRPGRG